MRNQNPIQSRKLNQIRSFERLPKWRGSGGSRYLRNEHHIQWSEFDFECTDERREKKVFKRNYISSPIYMFSPICNDEERKVAWTLVRISQMKLRNCLSTSPRGKDRRENECLSCSVIKKRTFCPSSFSLCSHKQRNASDAEWKFFLCADIKKYFLLLMTWNIFEGSVLLFVCNSSGIWDILFRDRMKSFVQYFDVSRAISKWFW